MTGRYDFSEEAGRGEKSKMDLCDEMRAQVLNKAIAIDSAAKRGVADLENNAAECFGEIQHLANELERMITQGFDEEK